MSGGSRIQGIKRLYLFRTIRDNGLFLLGSKLQNPNRKYETSEKETMNQWHNNKLHYISTDSSRYSEMGRGYLYPTFITSFPKHPSWRFREYNVGFWSFSRVGVLSLPTITEVTLLTKPRARDLRVSPLCALRSSPSSRSSTLLSWFLHWFGSP